MPHLGEGLVMVSSGRGMWTPIKTRVVRYSQVAKRPIAWLWPQRIALGKLTLLVGEAGLGKSLLALDLAARVSQGSAWPDDPQAVASLGSVIVFSAEDDQNDVVSERLAAAGADLERIITIEPEEYAGGPRLLRPFSLGEIHRVLEGVLAERSDCRLVVIDPISAYLGGADGNHNRQVSALLHPLGELARKQQVAIVGVGHLNKRTSASAIHRVTGASSLVSTARTVWGVVRDPDEAGARLMLAIKSNITQESQGLRFRLSKPEGAVTPRVEWEMAPVSISIEAASGGRRFSVARQKYVDAENHLMSRMREELSDGPQARQALCAKLPGSEEQHYRAADKLGVKKVKNGFQGEWLWMLPEHYPGWQAERARTRSKG